MTATNKLTMVDVQEMIPYFIWLKANRGKAIEASEQMDLLYVLFSIPKQILSTLPWDAC